MAQGFSVKTYGKWILAGEHAVLRGHSALVFPFYDRSLHLQFQPGGTQLSCELIDQASDYVQELFWKVVERGLGQVGRSRDSVCGKFTLRSNVPVGAGLGASATICAAVARWMEWQGWIESDRVYECARELENLFHGESSGVDIAVALSGQPLEFRRGLKPQPLYPLWQPQLWVSYSGQRGLTSECVAMVQEFHRRQPSVAATVDEAMAAAVEKAKSALTSPEDARQRLWLTQALSQAAQCFERWGLVTGGLAEHLRLLRDHGCLSAKPTGSGQGGYVVSLWDQVPTVPGVKMEQLHLLPRTTPLHCSEGHPS